jgi:hypothetical protein
MAVRFQTTRNIRRGFALVLLCLVGFTAAYSWQSWHAEKLAQLDQLSLLADLESKALDSYFANFESSLNLLNQELQAEKLSIKGERAHAQLKRFKQANLDLANINVVQPDGQLVASAINSSGSWLPNIAQEASFMRGREVLLNGPDFDIGRPFVGKLVNAWIIPLRYAMRDENGKLLYIIQATLPLTRQQSFWQSLYLPRDVILGLLRDDGYLLSRYPSPKAENMEAAYGKPRTGALIVSLRETHFSQMGVVEGAFSAGSMEVMAFHRLFWNPVTLMVAMPVSNVRTAWWKKIRRFICLCAFFC